MPQCVKCNEFFPPNYTEAIQGSKPDHEGNHPQECIFCKLNVSEVERETSHNSGKYTPYTKQQCVSDYKAFIKKLKERANAKDILKKADSFEGGVKI